MLRCPTHLHDVASNTSNRSSLQYSSHTDLRKVDRAPQADELSVQGFCIYCLQAWHLNSSSHL